MKILDNFASLLFFSSYFQCQTFSVSRRALDLDPDPVRILTDLDPDPGWFSGSRASIESLTQKIKIQKRVLANYLENFYGILNIFHRSGPTAPDPYPDPNTGSSSLPSRLPKLYIPPPIFFFGKRGNNTEQLIHSLRKLCFFSGKGGGRLF